MQSLGSENYILMRIIYAYLCIINKSTQNDEKCFFQFIGITYEENNMVWEMMKLKKVNSKLTQINIPKNVPIRYDNNNKI